MTAASNFRDIRKAKFFWIDNVVLDDERIGHKEIAVYATLCRFLNQDTGYCFPSYATLSQKTGLSRSSVIRVINYLIEIGYVSKEVRQTETGNQSNLYFLNDVNSIPSVMVTPPSVENTLPSVTDTPPLVSEVHPNNTKVKKTNITSYSKEFESFWSVYPNKKDKKGAFEKFKQALNRNHSVEAIIEGTKNYAKYCEVKGTVKDYIKHPKTFLHNDSFLDEYELELEQPKPKAYQNVITYNELDLEGLMGE